ncbi:hypothetical protein [Agrobacterium rosae]|uniref:hypothetical protein n=1 Tax=Agrobacterium rosae TaxID=1972867 RepID=UPI003B9DD59B
MVKRFKLMHDVIESHPVNLDTAVSLTQKRWPWYQQIPGAINFRFFGACPGCDNPVTLVALHDLVQPPHGRHTNYRVPGFPQFVPSAYRTCPYVLPPGRRDKNARRQTSELGQAIRRLAIQEFDRVVLVLSQDLGIPLSRSLAERMLRVWLAAQGYEYVGAHLRNVPWMIAYFAKSESLFGQKVDGIEELVQAIEARLPQATVSQDGRLEKGTAFYDLQLACLDHVVRRTDDHQIDESFIMRVSDFTKAKLPGDAATVFEKHITFDTLRFERLMATPPERARRNQDLLDIAARVDREF